MEKINFLIDKNIPCQHKFDLPILNGKATACSICKKKAISSDKDKPPMYMDLDGDLVSHMYLPNNEYDAWFRYMTVFTLCVSTIFDSTDLLFSVMVTTKQESYKEAHIPPPHDHLLKEFKSLPVELSYEQFKATSDDLWNIFSEMMDDIIPPESNNDGDST